MQSQQMAQMAAMNANNGSVDGTPIMANMPHPKRMNTDPREQLNTYIYDYFLRNKHFNLARAMLDQPDMKMSTGSPQKPSPNNRQNGADSMDEAENLPAPQLPANQMADNSFLLDWWVQFWDIYQATKSRTGPSKGSQYIQHTRNLTQMQNDQRNQRMAMTNPMNAQYQNAMMQRGLANGLAPNDLKRAAAMNNRPNGNPMAGMQMKNPAMLAAQMQRDGSGMDMNGQRPQSPGANENAPSPNKRPRVEGAMGAGNMPGNQFGEFAQQGQNAQQQKIEVYAQSLANQHRAALNNTASPQGMNPGVPGPPMAQPGLEDQGDIFAGNGPRAGVPVNAPAQGGNHALQDYQMQLMLLEQQNKKRLLMARQEQDSMSGPHQQGAAGGPGFANAMSPQGRPGPSPGPNDQMKRGTPKLGQQGLPGSPMPEGAMQRQGGSPAPNMNFDPNLAPPGMPPQFFPPGMQQQNPMMRPPSSHPGAGFNGQQMTQQQIEAMRNGQMANGAWRGPPQQPGMMPGPQQMGGPVGQNPQQRQQMPPPPAPSNDQPRPEPSPSQSNQAPPTPSQSNKAAPNKNQKKGAKDNKKPANKKGANAGATPAASNGEEPPTPTSSTPVAPITPVHKQSFQGQNGQPQQPVQPQQIAQQPMDNNAPPFGNIDPDPPFNLDLNFTDESAALETFDFDSFLQTGNDNDGFGLGDFNFDNTAEVAGDI